MEHNVKPVAHKYLDPIVRPIYDTFKGVPLIKKGMDFIGGIGKGLGIW